mmetsp:Transcript_15669/g.37026  ORF Transcript_15669/g.37026 Transcript_15669/m.37026 type:complete len:145 (+) Transcript_15669:158-592(+)
MIGAAAAAGHALAQGGDQISGGAQPRTQSERPGMVVHTVAVEGTIVLGETRSGGSSAASDAPGHDRMAAAAAAAAAVRARALEGTIEEAGCDGGGAGSKARSEKSGPGMVVHALSLESRSGSTVVVVVVFLCLQLASPHSLSLV